MSQKLSDEDVCSIRRACAEGSTPRIVLARRYGVHPLTIHRIATGRARSSIPGVVPPRPPGRQLRAHGVDVPSAKLTDEDVREIRRIYADGDVSQRALASRYKISHSVIARIVTRKSWAHVPDEPPETAPSSGLTRLTAEDVRAIRHEFDSESASRRELAMRYGVSTTSIHYIVRRMSYVDVPDGAA